MCLLLKRVNRGYTHTMYLQFGDIPSLKKALKLLKGDALPSRGHYNLFFDLGLLSPFA